MARSAELRDRAKHHKRAIAQHRSDLQAVARELSELEAMCAALGIGLHLRIKGEGKDVHGRPDTSS